MAKATGKSNKEVETMTDLIDRRRQQIQGEQKGPDVDMGDNTELRDIVAGNQELQRQNRGMGHQITGLRNQVMLDTGNTMRLHDLVDVEIRGRR
eukprot:12885115-Prorocentrum_lima.AAC.1